MQFIKSEKNIAKYAINCLKPNALCHWNYRFVGEHFAIDGRWYSLSPFARKDKTKQKMMKTQPQT